MHAENEIFIKWPCVCAVCLCLAGLVVVMAVVFVIVKVEPCICQSNRLENFNNDLYHDTRKSGSILSHTHTHSQTYYKHRWLTDFKSFAE